MLNKVRYDQKIPFIFIFWWFGPFWRRYFVDFIDNYLFYPLEMVENGLIRDWKWQLKNFKSLIMLSPTQQHHLWPNFNASDTPKEKILVIFSINTTFTPWLNRKCLIRAQICSKSDPVWSKCQDIGQKIAFYPLIWDKSCYPGSCTGLPTSVFGFLWCPT